MIDPQKSHVFAVGISSYHLGSDWRLPTAADHALAFAAWARQRGVPRAQIHLFLSMPDRARLAAALDADGVDAQVATYSAVTDFVFQKLTLLDGDLLYMFWAGHGSLSEDGSRALFFEDLSLVDRRHFDLNDFFATLRTSAFKRFGTQIAFVDACANRFEELGFAVSLGEARSGKGQFGHHGVHQAFFLAADSGEQAQAGEFGAAVLRALTDVGKHNAAWPPDQDAVVDLVRPQFEGAAQHPVQLVWTTASGDQHVTERASGDLPASASVNAAALTRQLPVRALRRLADIALQYGGLDDPGAEGIAGRDALFAGVAAAAGRARATRLRRSTPRLEMLHLVGAALMWDQERRLADAIGAFGGFELSAELDRLALIQDVRALILTLPATPAQLRDDFRKTTTRFSDEHGRDDALTLDAMLDELYQISDASEPQRPVWEFLLRLARRFDDRAAAIRTSIAERGASPLTVRAIEDQLAREQRFVLSIDVTTTYDETPGFEAICARLVVADTSHLVRAFPVRPVATWDDVRARAADFVTEARQLVYEHSQLREEALLIEFLLPTPFLTWEPHALPVRVAGRTLTLGQLHPVIVRLRERLVQRNNAINLGEWEDVAGRIDRDRPTTVHWMERTREAPTLATCQGVVALRFLPEDEIHDIVIEGFPFIAWLRSEPDAGDWAAFTQRFEAWSGALRLGELARQVRAIRRRPGDLGARLTLFWDDPNQIGHWPRLDEVATGGE